MYSLWGHFYFYFRSIRRIIFYSLIKPSINEKGEKELEPITTSQALQIAGRAGRFSSHFKEGEVTTMHREDLALLKEILNRPVPPIQVRLSTSLLPLRSGQSPSRRRVSCLSVWRQKGSLSWETATRKLGLGLERGLGSRECRHPCQAAHDGL